ncbi:MAG: hypothetical protein RLZZ01_1966 [Actinomycetota bacterium]|jgi:hypothetical protein
MTHTLGPRRRMEPLIFAERATCRGLTDWLAAT